MFPKLGSMECWSLKEVGLFVQIRLERTVYYIPLLKEFIVYFRMLRPLRNLSRKKFKSEVVSRRGMISGSIVTSRIHSRYFHISFMPKTVLVMVTGRLSLTTGVSCFLFHVQQTEERVRELLFQPGATSLSLQSEWTNSAHGHQKNAIYQFGQTNQIHSLKQGAGLVSLELVWRSEYLKKSQDSVGKERMMRLICIQ